MTVIMLRLPLLLRGRRSCKRSAAQKMKKTVLHTKVYLRSGDVGGRGSGEVEEDSVERSKRRRMRM